MLLQIARFELLYRLRRPATWLYFILFLTICLLMVMVEGVTVGGVPSAANKNAPYSIALVMGIFTAFGIMVTSAMMSTPIIRDFEHSTHPLIFSLPISKWQYLGGRYLGSLIMTLFVFLSLPIGLMLGYGLSLIFGLHVDKFGSFSLWSYFQPFLFIAIPNILFAGSVFFALSTLTKKVVYSYLGNIVLLVGYVVAINLIGDMDNLKIAALFDPFGIISLQQIVRYWTVSEFNVLLVIPDWLFMLNRVIWIGIGALLMAFTLWKFSFTLPSTRKTKVKIDELPILKNSLNDFFPKSIQRFSFSGHILLMVKQAWLYFVGIIKDIAFIAIMLAGVGLVASGAISMGSHYSTDYLPVTYSMLESLGGSFVLFIYIILTFYSGELIWKERSVKLNQIYDTFPVPDWLSYSAKFLGMVFLTLFMLLLLMIICIGVQVSHSYYHFEIGQYLYSLFVLEFSSYLLLIPVILLIHALSPNKFVGFVIVMVYYLLVSALPGIGVDDRLFVPLSGSSYVYSDMNGYGDYLTSFFWFILYWGFFSVMLWIIGNAALPRGTETSFRSIINRVRYRIKKRGLKYALIIVIVGFFLTGGFIWYNTHVINKFFSTKDSEKLAVKFENSYKFLKAKAQPNITACDVNVDIFPDERRVEINGQFWLKNTNKVTVDTVYLNLPAGTILSLSDMRVGGVKADLVDPYFGLYKIDLKSPMKPGDSSLLIFKYKLEPKGFSADGPETWLAGNGSFFNSKEVLPVVGYNAGQELSSKDKRKKYNLPVKPGMPPINDTAMWYNTYLGNDGHWIDFKATVSTSSSQIALAPGELKKQWKVGDRNYYRYESKSKILNFYSFLSARYEIKKEDYKGISLEIYYHKGHEYNLQSMFKAMKSSLDYFQKNFSPYQNNTLRIVEFPRYASFAQSFPATIPYSESIGFIADLRDKDAIDYIFYVTAHEIAHQWWAHQVIGANVQGATLMSEALAQYSALMVMEKEYGKGKMRRFLKYELDKYLTSRKYETDREWPISLNENQGYIHYNKGSLVMYALRDYIGEDSLNRALASFVNDFAYCDPPFPRSYQFLEYLRRATPDSMQYLIKDMFETITLYSNRCVSADARKLNNGKYEVTLVISSDKLRCDEKGVESPITYADYIDVGLLKGKDLHEDVLEMRKVLLKKGETTVTFVVDELPDSGGVDPLNKLIDRDSDDNRMTITLK